MEAEKMKLSDLILEGCALVPCQTYQDYIVAEEDERGNSRVCGACAIGAALVALTQRLGVSPIMQDGVPDDWDGTPYSLEFRVEGEMLNGWALLERYTGVGRDTTVDEVKLPGVDRTWRGESLYDRINMYNYHHKRETTAKRLAQAGY